MIISMKCGRCGVLVGVEVAGLRGLSITVLCLRCCAIERRKGFRLVPRNSAESENSEDGADGQAST